MNGQIEFSPCDTGVVPNSVEFYVFYLVVFYVHDRFLNENEWWFHWEKITIWNLYLTVNSLLCFILATFEVSRSDNLFSTSNDFHQFTKSAPDRTSDFLFNVSIVVLINLFLSQINFYRVFKVVVKLDQDEIVHRLAL